MRNVYIVWAKQYGKQYYGNDMGIAMAAYTTREQAEKHRDFIDGIDNNWYAYIFFMSMFSVFNPDVVTGLKDLRYEEYDS